MVNQAKSKGEQFKLMKYEQNTTYCFTVVSQNVDCILPSRSPSTASRLLAFSHADALCASGTR